MLDKNLLRYKHPKNMEVFHMDSRNNINLKDFFVSLSHLLDLGDANLSFHQIRTSFIAWKIGEGLNLPLADLNRLVIGSLVHDIGAISLEEKVRLHNFEFEKLEIHAYRGFFILQKIDGFQDIARMVRYHHKSYKDLGDNELLAQIINLSDSVERSIDRNKLILEQNEDIIRKHSNSDDFHPLVLASFLKVSYNEIFWHNLANPRIRDLLYKCPLCNVEVPRKMIIDLSFLIRDIIDFKSPFTLRHSVGVMFCVQELSKKLQLSDDDTEDLIISALLHDVGKLMIPTDIIMKPGPLNKWEKSKMDEHPYYTFMFLKEAGYSDKICLAASYHHESSNGKGYPFRVREESIPIEAKMIAASDVFVALYEDRPYRKALSKSEIEKIMYNYSEDKLDERMVKLLMDSYEEIDNELKQMNNQLMKEYEIFNEIESYYEEVYRS